MSLTDKQTILKRPVNLQLNLSYEKEHKTMKHKGEFLLNLLALGFLLSCTQTPEQIAEKGSDATVHLFTEDTKGQRTSIGSGFFVRHNQIATNIHVVLISKQKVLAKLVHTEKWFTIEGVTAFDAQNDLVILKTVEGGAKYLPLGDSDAVQRLDLITVIGSPHLAKESLGEEIEEGKRSTGYIRSPRITEDSNWLYLAAEVGPGTSGGPVLNSNNEVIGILSKGNLLGDSGYAIPSNELKALLKRLESAEPLSRWLEKAPIRAWASFGCGRNKRAFGSWKNKDEKAREYKKAIKDLDKAIGLYPKFARAHYLRGRVQLELDQYQAAIKDFDKTIELVPDFASAYYYRGNARLRLYEGVPGKREAILYAAIKDFNKVIELSPDATAINNIAIMELVKGVPGKREAAILYAVIKNFNKVIELKSNSTDPIDALESKHFTMLRGHTKYILGLSEETLGKREAAQSLNEAIEDFNTIIKLVDTNATVYYERGLVYKALGRHKEAEDDFKKAKELDPNVDK